MKDIEGKELVFGQRVIVSSKIERVTLTSNGVCTRSWEWEAIEPVEAIYIGYRLLRDGTIRGSNSPVDFPSFEEPEPAYLSIHKVHTVYLVVKNERSKPFYSAHIKLAPEKPIEPLKPHIIDMPGGRRVEVVS